MDNQEKLATPLWNLNNCSEEVYEPREDSFLLLDTLQEDLKFIRSIEPLYILEIGSGSGIIITALGCALKNVVCLGVDINPKACEATMNTAELNGTTVHVVNGDLVKGLELSKKVDVLLFNPPYVPSVKEDEKEIIDKAWAGAAKGREVTMRLLPYLRELMAENSVGYIVAIDDNKPEELCQMIYNLGFEVIIAKRRKIIGEILCVIRFTSNKHTMNR